MKTALQKLTDDEIIRAYKESGNKDFVGELYRRYVHLVFGVCMKYLRDQDDSRDAVMQIFEQLFEKLKKHEIQFFKAWLHMVAKNHCLMHLRSQRSHLVRNVDLENSGKYSVELEVELHHIPERDEKMLPHLNTAIASLNQVQKNCIELFFIRNQSYEQIMEQTGMNYKEVKSHLQNGKRNLKIYLEKNHG